MREAQKNKQRWLVYSAAFLLICAVVWIVGPQLPLSGSFPLASPGARGAAIAALAGISGLVIIITSLLGRNAAQTTPDSIAELYPQPEDANDPEPEPDPEIPAHLPRHLGCLGHFGQQESAVTYNLPQIFIDTWHDWTASQMAHGESELLSKWHSTYASSQAYRFVLSSGIAGNEAWAGVMAPGANSAGKQSPVCIAAALPHGAQPLSVAQGLEDWFLCMEEFLNEVREEQFDMAGLSTRLKELSHTPMISSEDLSECEFIAGKPDGSGQLSVRASNTSLLHSPSQQSTLLDAIMQQTFFQYSLWMTARSRTTRESNTMVSAGMPLYDHGLALFTGDWINSGSGNLILPGTILSDEDRQRAMLDIPADVAADTMRNNLAYNMEKGNIEKGNKAAEAALPSDQTRVVPLTPAADTKSTTTPWKI